MPISVKKVVRYFARFVCITQVENFILASGMNEFSKAGIGVYVKVRFQHFVSSTTYI